MNESLKAFLFNLTVSIFIGLFVGMAQVTAINMNSSAVETLVMSSLLGGVIGTISRFIFIYILCIKQRNTKLAFIAVFIIIGAISCIPSLYYYLFQNKIISTTALASILVSAELLGMGFCYYSYKKYLDFNLKLLNKKKQLTVRD